MFILNNRVIRVAILGALLPVLAGCSRHPSDETVSKDIQKKIAADPDTKDSQVIVAVKDGKVVLTGTIQTPAKQQKLEQIARAEPGAADVDDRTTVQANTFALSQPIAEPAAASPVPSPAPPLVQEPKPKPVVVPSGTHFTVRLQQSLGSATSQTGQVFLATLTQPLTVQGMLAVPAGSTVSGRVVEAKAKGKIKGEGVLNLALTSVTCRGQTYPIQTNLLENTTKGKGKRTAVTTGGGAAGGALLGGIVGGGKGAGIGALVGAGAGFVGGAATGNQQIQLPAEAALSFRLTVPLTLPPRS